MHLVGTAGIAPASTLFQSVANLSQLETQLPRCLSLRTPVHYWTGSRSLDRAEYWHLAPTAGVEPARSAFVARSPKSLGQWVLFGGAIVESNAKGFWPSTRVQAGARPSRDNAP